MARESRRTMTPETALRLTIDALGGPQEVAVDLDPAKYEDAPDVGGQWISHCIDPDRREKLALRQMVRIFRRAHSENEHDGFRAFAKVCGYNAEPVLPATELAHLKQQADEAVRSAREAQQQLAMLIDNPRLLAQMQAIGLKTESLL